MLTEFEKALKRLDRIFNKLSDNVFRQDGEVYLLEKSYKLKGRNNFCSKRRFKLKTKSVNFNYGDV
jgi:hypothetical protein